MAGSDFNPVNSNSQISISGAALLRHAAASQLTHNGESAVGAIGPMRTRNNNRGPEKIMKKIKFEKPKGALAPEMVTLGEVKKSEYLPSEDKAEKLAGSFKIPGYDELLLKEWALNLDAKSILRKDAATMLDKPLTDEDLVKGEGFDPNSLVGHKVAVVVVHKATAGGKLTAVIGPIFRVERLKEMVAAMEE